MHVVKLSVTDQIQRTLDSLVVYSDHATRWVMEGTVLDSWQGQQGSLFSIASRPALRSTQPPTQWVTGAVSPGIRRQWRESDPSLSSNTEVRNGGSTYLYFTMAWCLIN
jgi:hypothetical protein